MGVSDLVDVVGGGGLAEALRRDLAELLHALHQRQRLPTLPTPPTPQATPRSSSHARPSRCVGERGKGRWCVSEMRQRKRDAKGQA
eukprot:299677-Rhodomonas_salina.2